MIHYPYNVQKQPPAPFVRVVLRHPFSGAELKDLSASLDTGADQTLVPTKYAEQLSLDFSGSVKILGVGNTGAEMQTFSVSIGISKLTMHTIEVVAHPGEPWILLGRDILNSHRIVFDGPQLVLDIE